MLAHKTRKWLDANQGSYSKLPALTEEQAYDLRQAVAKSGWKMNLQRAAFYVIDQAARSTRGQRFQIPVRELGDALGMSPASGSRYLKQLRDKGLIQMFRAHQIHLSNEGDFWGEATINEINPAVLVDRVTSRTAKHPSERSEDTAGEGPSREERRSERSERRQRGSEATEPLA